MLYCFSHYFWLDLIASPLVPVMYVLEVVVVGMVVLVVVVVVSSSSVDFRLLFVSSQTRS